MQGEERIDRQLLDAAGLAGHLVPPGGMFAFLAAHRGEVFPDGEFADLFPSTTGRPSIPATVMAAVMALQTLHDYSDRETAEAVRFDVRWKVACGLAIDDEGFDPSTLVYWRRRLAGSRRPHRINDAVRKVIEQTAVVKGRRRAVDSTILADAVATQDTITQLISAIRRVARQVPGAAEQIAAVCTGHDYSSPAKPKIDWDDPEAKDALVSALVNDANAVVAALQGAQLEEAAASALALLALVAGQDVEPAEGSDGTDGRWRIARKTAPDRMISTVDPQARHAHKTRERRQDGFKAHVVVEPDTGLITEAEVTKVNGPENSDATKGAALLDADTTLPDPAGEGSPRPREPIQGRAGHDTAETTVEVLGDSAYGTGEMLDSLEKAGRKATIKPWPTRPAVPDGFTIDDFAYDDEAGTLTCPNGVTRTLTRKRNVVFGAVCRNCPLRDKCTTSASGRTVHVHRHETLQRRHRQRAQDPAFQHTYRAKRPLVERSIAWLTRGNRRVPYRGIAKNNAWLHHRIAALNLRRLLALGLVIQNGGWQIA